MSKNKETYKCPKCGSEKFRVKKTIEVSFPLKGILNKDSNVIVFDVDNNNRTIWSECDIDNVYCLDCNNILDKNKIDYDTNVPAEEISGQSIFEED